MSKEYVYGFFPGGTYDPRKFEPDQENSPEELAAHKAACEAWNRGERTTVPASGTTVDLGGGSAAILCGSKFGMGTYEIEFDD